MKPIEIKKGVYWVGGIDWDLRNFHGYMTQRGSTYNSYLIVDESVTLIDNVKDYTADQMLQRISRIVDPADIDYIIQNHIEMDHSGSLPLLLEKAPQATIYASPKGVENLPKLYNTDWNFTAVKSGDSISLGNPTLTFVQTPMVHWPDTMVTYCPEDKLLFSNDAFGQHISSSERFDDEYPFSILMQEAEKYYANIVLPYGKQVQKAMDGLSGLDIDMICPSHGLIWRSKIKEILAEYAKWAHNKTDKKAVIVYDTMWNSTEKIAYAVQSAFEENNYQTRMCNLQFNHISDIMTEILTAEYVCVGSPTLNNNMLPAAASFLTYLKGLSPKNRKGLAFGSYGWSGESVSLVEEALKESGFELGPAVNYKYVPNAEALKEISKQVADYIS